MEKYYVRMIFAAGFVFMASPTMAQAAGGGNANSWLVIAIIALFLPIAVLPFRKKLGDRLTQFIAVSLGAFSLFAMWNSFSSPI